MFVFDELTKACNSRCITCSYWHNSQEDELCLQERSWLVNAMACEFGERVKGWFLTGGEPLLNPDVSHIGRLVRNKMPQAQIHLATNGILLADHASEIVDFADIIWVSIDGHNEATYESIRGVRNLRNLKEAVRRVRAIAAKTRPDVNIMGCCTVQRGNYRYLAKIIHMGWRMGLDSMFFKFPDVRSATSFGREGGATSGHGIDRIMLNEDEVAEFSVLLKRLIVKNRRHFESGFLLHDPLDLERKLIGGFRAHLGIEDPMRRECRFPTQFAFIGSKGEIRPCFYMESKGNVRHVMRDSSKELSEAVGPLAPEMLEIQRAVDCGDLDICRNCPTPMT